ncbi:MAG: peptide ABC transporter substrate-binding protein [Sediminimonas qiaohouensis]|uniref:Peptide ABC transporter substrate-binding protein n=1 Tax=Sediminimonas qiaohouensis TaxID=552061 RepID=A0A7C9HI22_9RHOB|nr:ABC transporter substrate-binding protein [Sediminimonas qiaohouensis]MTJ03852.1 peptide ABC transporter substrate-binding protein [Sediminimonas qiaohouensis]
MTSSRQRPLAGINRRQLLAGTAGLSALTMLPVKAWAEGAQLNVRAYLEPDNFDPLNASGFLEELLYGCIYRKLIQYTPGDEWGYQNDLADTIEQTSPTTIAFTMKTGQMWSDGYGEITAEDIKYSMERHMVEENNSRIKPDLGPFSHVEVTGTHSGIIHLDKPFAPIWTIALPYLAGTVVCKRATEEAGGKLDSAVPPTVAGPYRVVEQRLGERWVLERNPDFSGPTPDFERVDLVVIVDESAAEIAKEAGDVDFTAVGPGSVQRLQDNPPEGMTLSLHSSLAYYWIGLNVNHPKFEDIRVRQAVQHAIDVPAILQAAFFDVADPATGIVAPGLIGHRPEGLIPPQADFAKARALLDEAGIDRLEVNIDVLNNVTATTTAQVMQAMMAQAGIDLNISVHESGSFWSLGVESDGDRWKDLELTLKRFSMTPDPYYATAWFVSDQIGDWNWEQFSNPEFDKLHEEALSETDTDKRDAMYRRMQDLMEESGAYRFITHGATPNLYDTDIVPATRPDGLPLVQFFRKA